MISYILEQKENGVPVDIYSRLLLDRIIFLNQEIDSECASLIQAQLLYLSSLDANKPIYLYINSPGGCVVDGLAIYDTMQFISAPVHTICTGLAASMAAILLASGDKRYSLPHSSIMIHQPSGGAFGQTTDVLIQAKLLEKDKQILAEILSKHTNKPLSIILKDMDRDYWMDAKEALSYNIIDEIK